MKRLLSALLLAVALTGCAVVSPIVRDSLNQVGDAVGILSYGPGSIVVTPPNGGLHGVTLDVQGVALIVEHDACSVIQVGHVQCVFGLVNGIVTVPVSGINVTATASYRLADQWQIRHEILAN